MTSSNDISHSGPSHKPSISQSSDELKPRLSVTAELIEREKGRIHFSIDCNYFLFVKRAELKIFDENQKLTKTIELPMPLPLRFVIARNEVTKQSHEQGLLRSARNDKREDPSQVPGGTGHPSPGSRHLDQQGRVYYQLSVFNANGKEDRTVMGSIST